MHALEALILTAYLLSRLFFTDFKNIPNMVDYLYGLYCLNFKKIAKCD